MQKGAEQKAEKFVKQGGQLYRKAWPRILKTLRTRPQ